MLGRGPGLVLSCVAFWLSFGCGGTQSATQTHALHAGAEYLRCPLEYAQLRGRARTSGRFVVEACMRRVTVECTWGAGVPECTPEPVLEERRAAAERAHAQREAQRAQRTAAQAAVAPRLLPTAAAFRVEPGLGGNDVLALDLLFGPVEARARTSRDLRERVVLSITLAPTARRSASCPRELLIEAAGEVLRFEQQRQDAETSHFIIAADDFDSFAQRVPLRLEICGNQVGFGHRELRALRAFVAAHERFRADRQ